MHPRIFFSGKVSSVEENREIGPRREYLYPDWRVGIIPAESLYLYADDPVYYAWGDTFAVEPISRSAFVYTGPYLSDDPNTGHHGIWGDLGRCRQSEECKDHILAQCLRRIDASDILFAWLDTELSAYGSYAEIGYAKGRGKQIWVAIPRSASEEQWSSYRDKCAYDDLWFVTQMADEVLWAKDLTPQKALATFFSRQMGSAIEKKFWNTWKKESGITDLLCQYQIGRYRVDFAHEATKTVIELDGFANHSSTEDVAYDCKRQRALEALGWKVVRFGGKEIYHNVEKCVEEAHEIVVSRLS